MLLSDVMVSMIMCTVSVQQWEDQVDIDNIVVARNEVEIRVRVSSGCILRLKLLVTKTSRNLLLVDHSHTHLKFIYLFICYYVKLCTECNTQIYTESYEYLDYNNYLYEYLDYNN